MSGMTLEEAFTGHKPCVSHLRVFGCRAYVHIPKHKRHTLDAKSTPMIFTGYATRSKGFHFWDLCCSNGEHTLLYVKPKKVTTHELVVVAKPLYPRVDRSGAHN